jgi:serine/threonine-protein kinase
MLKPGDRFGRFRLERELGRGPMSEVFLAIDDESGWKAAYKVFLLEPGSQPADRALWAQRMVREAATAAAFQHPNIVKVHEVGAMGGDVPYLVRDFIVGRALSEFVTDRAPGHVARKLPWLRDFAGTLADIHRAGLVHREVKTSNALVRRDGALRLLDFGVARRSVDREAGLVGPTVDKSPSGSERARVFGTPAYLAPERFAHQASSRAADQFAWGVVAYELLAGHLPWGDGKRLRPIRMIDAILTDSPRPLRARTAEVPPEVDAVVARAMAKLPTDRFHTMDEVFRAMQAAVR